MSKHLKHLLKTADQTIFGTDFVTDDELQFAAPANTTWALHFDLINSADDIADNNDRMKMTIVAPSGSTARVLCFATVDDGTNGISGGAMVQGPLLPVPDQTIPGNYFGFGAPGATQNPAYAWVRIAQLHTVGSVAGQVGLQYAEYASGGSSGCTMYAGSSLVAKKA